MKRTTEVSGNQTPEACSSLSCVSTHQSCASLIPAWYQVYVRPCGTTQNFLTVLCHFWHSVSTRKIYHQLQGYSEFGQYSLRSLLNPVDRVMLVFPLLNSSIRYFSFTMNLSVIVCE
jgi:hypothetical protein